MRVLRCERLAARPMRVGLFIRHAQAFGSGLRTRDPTSRARAPPSRERRGRLVHDAAHAFARLRESICTAKRRCLR